MKENHPLQSISDDELLRRLAELMRDSRRVESELVAHIAEVDGRRLYAREASPSMFAYCTEVLHLSEAEAYLRIAAARASRDHPVLLTMLGDGRLHLTGIAKLAPHLTRENAEGLLKRAVHKSKRQIEELIAAFAPRPDAPALMRKLPAPSGQAQLTASLSRGEGERALSVELGSTHELRQDGVVMPDPESGLERPAIHPLRPDAVGPSFATSPAPPATVVALAPGRYISSAKVADKRSEKRHIPAAVRRAVYERDGSRCRFVDGQGRRCTERHRLEFHHCHPFALGGDHGPGSIRLMCRAHNLYLAEQDYGKRAMARHRGSGNHVSGP